MRTAFSSPSELLTSLEPLPSRSQTGTADAAAAIPAELEGRRFRTILAEPPWQFENRTGNGTPPFRCSTLTGATASPRSGYQIRALSPGSISVRTTTSRRLTFCRQFIRAVFSCPT